MGSTSTYHIAYISLGSNFGDSKKELEKAIELMAEHVGKIIQVSDIYRTKAWGLQNQADFLNQVVGLETDLYPHDLLKKILGIESEMGRERKVKWGQRNIDLDILLYDDYVIDTQSLVIPHPRMHERNFVLYPLFDLNPFLVHPIFRQTIRELKAWCQDELDVHKLKSK